MHVDYVPAGWSRSRITEQRMYRYLSLHHQSLEAIIDVCPPENSEGLFDVDDDAFAVAKLYTRHEDLEGYEWREQLEVASSVSVSDVVSALVQTYEAEYQSGASDDVDDSVGVELPEAAENRSLDDF